MSALDHPLPTLRADLEFHRGPDGPDGAPILHVLDPVAGVYHQLHWAEATILRHLRDGGTLRLLLGRLRRETTLRAAPEQIQAVLRQAEALRLVLPSGAPAAEAAPKPTAETARRGSGPFASLVRGASAVFYMRFPLLAPDPFLRATVPVLRPLVSRPLVALYVILWLMGLAWTLPRAEAFLYTARDFFSPTGALVAALVLTGLKGIHEFAHAYTAAALGVTVRSMGISLLVLWPIPYTDVTDAWRLRRRRERFWIGAAGMAAETVVAGFALVLWNLTPPGMVNSLCFLVAATSLATTLLANSNPAMRFDGYYLLADAWGLDNLQPRAFALTRWWLRGLALGLVPPDPEPLLGRRTRAAMMLYAAYAWLYRIGLYTGIAAMVYGYVAKSVGVMLLAMAIGMFFVVPAMGEAVALWRLRGWLRWSIRPLLTAALLAAGIWWFLAPTPRRLVLPAVVTAAERQVVYAPNAGRVAATSLERGRPVRAGAVLLEIDSPALQGRLPILRARRAELLAQLRAIEAEEHSARSRPRVLDRLGTVEAEIAGLRERLARNRVRADLAGMVVEAREGLRVGDWLAGGEAVAVVEAVDRARVTAFVAEADRRFVTPGGAAWWRGPDGGAPLRAVIAARAPIRQDHLAPDTAALASIHGGPLPTTSGAGRPVAESVGAGPSRAPVLRSSYYRVEVDLPDGLGATAPGVTGSVVLWTPPQSPARRLYAHLRRLFLRESAL